METPSEAKIRQQKALALILVLFVGLMWVETVYKPYFYPPQVITVEVPSATTDAAATGGSPTTITSGQGVAGQNQTAEQSLESGGVIHSSGYPADELLKKEEYLVEAKTEDINAQVSLLGGRLVSLELNKFLGNLGKDATNLNLVEHVEGKPLPLGVYSGDVDDSKTIYQLAEGSVRGPIDATKEPSSVLLTGKLPDGRAITKKLTFYPKGYIFDVEANIDSPAPDSSRVGLEWTYFDEQADSSMFDPYNIKSFVWFDGEKAERESLAELEEPRKFSDIIWLSSGDKYFTSTLLSKNEKAPGEISASENLFITRLLGDATKASFSVLAGPKRYKQLQETGFELQRNIDFGWTGIIAAPLLSTLLFFYGLFGNYGLAIVALTICVRMAVYPLNAASYKSMKAMEKLKPEMDRLKETVTDKQQQQMELMALYKKKGVNPLGGCLPALVQLPIFIGLYSALMLAVELRHAPFAGWIEDLSAPEHFEILGFGIPVMVILMVISMLVMQWTTPTTMDPTQKKVMLVIPIVMGFMFANFPAGLTLYFLTSNLISIGQTKGMQHAEKPRRSAFAITSTVCLAVFLVAFLIVKL